MKDKFSLDDPIRKLIEIIGEEMENELTYDVEGHFTVPLKNHMKMDLFVYAILDLDSGDIDVEESHYGPN